ncbi:MAG: T9SS type A sorting domain-containing protein [Ignavibacteriales bacterium]|nr:T9SS type A sorting domain-containing protein [Ignavibacteriales bacterium]
MKLFSMITKILLLTFFPCSILFGADTTVVTPLKSGLFGGNGRDIDFVSSSLGFIVGDDVLLSNNFIGKTTDGGATWTNITPPELTNRPWAVDFLDEQNGYVAGFGGLILKTVDGGATWGSVNNSNYAGNIYDLVFTSSLVGYACGTNDTGIVLKTTDGGTNWSILQTPVTSARYTIEFYSDEEIFIGGSTGSILRTTDSGISWTNIIIGASTFYKMTKTSDNTIWAVNSSEALYKSTNRGESFSLVFDNGSSVLYNIGFADDLHGFIVGSSGTTYKTSDGWQTYDTVATSAFTSQACRAVYMTSPENIVVVADQGNILHSTNGGTAWKYVESSTRIYCIDFLNENFGIAAGFGGTIYKTTDGGTSWVTLRAIQGTTLYDVQVFDENSFYVSGASGTMFKTEDGGSTFTKVVLPAVTGASKSLWFFDKDNGYCTGEMGGIYYTSDGGNSWTSQFTFGTTSNNVEDIFFLNDTLGFAFGERGKFVKTTNRTTWDSIGIDGPSIYTLWEAQFLSPSLGYLGSTNGAIYKTSDGGATWALQNDTSRLFGVDIIDIGIVDSTRGYAVGEMGHLFQMVSENDFVDIMQLNTQYGSPVHLWGIDFVSNTKAYLCGYYGMIYKLEINPQTGLTERDIPHPQQYSLLSSYPNPFNPSTTIRFEIPKKSFVTLKIFDEQGKEITTLTSQQYDAGTYNFEWNGSKMASGVYFCKIETEYSSKTVKLSLVK